MKQIIMLVLLLSLAAVTFSQQSEPVNANVNVDYLKKSKNQKTAAWILTSAGTIAIAAAFIHDLNNIFTDSKSLTGFYIAGASMISGGVILFTASGRNKRKAASTSTAFLQTRFIMGTSMIKGDNKNYPALNITVKF